MYYKQTSFGMHTGRAIIRTVVAPSNAHAVRFETALQCIALAGVSVSVCVWVPLRLHSAVRTTGCEYFNGNCVNRGHTIADTTCIASHRLSICVAHSKVRQTRWTRSKNFTIKMKRRKKNQIGLQRDARASTLGVAVAVCVCVSAMARNGCQTWTGSSR